MIIEYTIDESDFLTHQLYIASKSGRIKKKRRRGLLLTPIIYIICALWFLYREKPDLAIIFGVISILWFFLYPLWDKKRYIKHFKGFIKETYKEQINRLVILELDADFIIVKDSGNESKILRKEIEEINEIATIILVRLKTGHSLILPKDKIKNIDVLISRLKKLALVLSIPYTMDENWKWK